MCLLLKQGLLVNNNLIFIQVADIPDDKHGVVSPKGSRAGKLIICVTSHQSCTVGFYMLDREVSFYIWLRVIYMMC